MAERSARLAIPTLTIAGLAVYAFARVAVDSFYGSLDIRPEDVGLNYITILTYTAVPMIVVTGAVLLILAWATPLVRILDLQERVLACVVVVANAVALLAISLDFADPGHNLILDAIVPEIVWVVAAGTIVLRHTAWFRARFKAKSGLSGTVLAGALLAFALVQALAPATDYGVATAAHVRAGQGILRLVGPFDFRADRVCVSWISSTPPPGLDLTRPLIYLGESDGTVVLYRGGSNPDAGFNGPLRLPASQVVVLRAHGDVTKCP